MQEKAKNSEIALIACKRAIRNASADEKYGNLTPPGFPQKIRPDLGFEHQHNRRPRGVESPPDAKGPIQRKIDDGIGKGQAFARQRLPRVRGRRDHERPIGVGLFQPPRESNAGKGFADTHRMNPDRARGMPGQLGERRK